MEIRDIWVGEGGWVSFGRIVYIATGALSAEISSWIDDLMQNCSNSSAFAMELISLSLSHRYCVGYSHALTLRAI